MIKITKKTNERIQKGIKRFQPILVKAKEQDINESDTVTIITDMLCDIFGYDKYENITSEYAIKKTFCDLAIKLDDTKPSLLIECKAIGLNLKDDFVRQATNYAADSGIDWVILTNGIDWKVYKIHFTKPIEKELVYEFDILNIDLKKQSDLENLFYLSIESLSKNNSASLNDLYAQKQVINRHIIGQLLLTDPIINLIKRQLKKLSPDTAITAENILSILSSEVLKREIVEGDECKEAKKKIKKLDAKK